MASTVASILQSIEELSWLEQQELVMALIDRVPLDGPLEIALGVDPAFVPLDSAGKRDLLRQKLLSGLEQVQQGRVIDGELVFARLEAKLNQESTP